MMDSSELVSALLPMAVGVIFLIIGIILLVVAIRSRQQVQAAQAWQIAPARILSNSIREHVQRDKDSTRRTYEPVIEYEYAVINQNYTGRRIAFGANRFDRSQAQELLERFPVDSTPDVYYNPANPAEAVLLREARSQTTFLALGIILLVLGLGILCLGSAFGLFLPALQSPAP